LPSAGYQYAVEFRHPSCNTEGPWEMLKHYDIEAVMTDSPTSDNLQFLSKVTITSKNHSFIRFHGRDSRHRYNYLYSTEELKPWVDKVKEEIIGKTDILRIYFNNHYGAKAVINAFEFKKMLGISPLSKRETNALIFAKSYYSRPHPTYNTSTLDHI
jgi:uncharacterized protein YecE (DUF72 family)